jgi:Protein of unknown function (DUF416)
MKPVTYSDFTHTLQKQVPRIPRQRQLQLALRICKELFFEYQKFYEVYQWGNPDVLLEGIRICDKASISNAEIPKIQELLQQLDSVTPDMDDFGSDALGSYALNAAASVYETLEFLMDNDSVHIFNIATYYTDTIAVKIQEIKSLTLEEIDAHPLTIETRKVLLEQTR